MGRRAREKRWRREMREAMNGALLREPKAPEVCAHLPGIGTVRVPRETAYRLAVMPRVLASATLERIRQ